MRLEAESTSVREQDYILGPSIVDKTKESAIAGRNILFWDEYSRFWQPALTKGRECWDYVVGEYFSPSEISDYNLKEKIIINIPGLINKVNALESMQLTGRRNGVIVPVGAADAPDKDTINYVLQAIHRANGVADEKTATFTDGIVTGYPSVIWFDKDNSWDKAKDLEIYHEHWDSVLLDPLFSRSDLSDCRRIQRARLMSKDEMKIAYPKRAKVIDAEIKEGSFQKDDFQENAFSSTDRDRIYSHLNSAQTNFNSTGKMWVIESCFFVYISMEIWWDTKTGDFQMLPPDWDQQAINRWIEMSPNAKRVTKDVRLLWTTVSTQSGILLENNRHWFQMNEFPAEVYIPKMWNNSPRGVIEFLRGTTKGEAVTDIEHLHSLRQVNDDLVIVQENAIVNAQDLNRERARTGGTIVTREGVPVSEAINFPLSGKRENMGWSEFAEKMRVTTDRLSTTPNFEGIPETSQESGKAISTRNRATEKKFSPYMNTYHSFDLRVTRKTLMMIPYVITEEKIYRHTDDMGRPVEVEVNKPAQRDMMTGDPIRIINNLNGAKYDYIPAVTDDSISAREYELEQFKEILRDTLPTTPQEYWIPLLMSVGNTFAMKMAQRMKEVQEELKNQEPAPERMKKTLSINSEDLMNNKIVQSILINEGVLDPSLLQKQPQPPMTGEQNVNI